MLFQFRALATIVATGCLLAGCATNFSAAPVPKKDQEVRYDQGTPTTFSDKDHSSIQVTPMGYNPEDKRLIFGVAAFNKITTAMNFGLENVEFKSADGSGLKTYSRDELAHEAKVKAEWAAVATVLAGAAAAYAANANAYHTTSGYVFTPRGSATFYARTYDPGLAYAGTAAAGAATGYGLVSIKHSLDSKLSQLNGEILQVNTVDPGQSVGGEVVVDLPKSRDFPQGITLNVNWAGEVHSFDFIVAKAQ